MSHSPRLMPLKYFAYVNNKVVVSQEVEAGHMVRSLNPMIPAKGSRF